MRFVPGLACGWTHPRRMCDPLNRGAESRYHPADRVSIALSERWGNLRWGDSCGVAMD